MLNKLKKKKCRWKKKSNCYYFTLLTFVITGNWIKQFNAFTKQFLTCNRKVPNYNFSKTLIKIKRWTVSHSFVTCVKSSSIFEIKLIVFNIFHIDVALAWEIFWSLKTGVILYLHSNGLLLLVSMCLMEKYIFNYELFSSTLLIILFWKILLKYFSK